ncbi:MAG: hypothetical protein ACOWYE_08485 [Desulfatiglandales bacterium]
MSSQSSQPLLKSLIREAELYRIQGLLAQSKEKYLKVLALAEKSRPSSKRQKVIDAVSEKLQTVKRELEEVSADVQAPKLSHEVQTLIKKLFSFSKTEETAALAGAVALAKFGQYEQALVEFNQLLDHKTLALVAGKNILRCHLSLSTPEAAVDQFSQWVRGEGPFQRTELTKIRSFLINLVENLEDCPKIPEISEDSTSQPDFSEEETMREELEGASTYGAETRSTEDDAAATDEEDRQGSGRDLIEPASLEEEYDLLGEGTDSEEDGKSDLDDILDISSIKIRFHSGHLQGKFLELKVTFQVGNVVSVIIPSKKRPLLRYFGAETELPHIQVTSPMTVFDASGKVLGKTDVKSGPNKGDFMLDIIVYAS